ncbi:MAG: hypothetical protein LC136_16850 [Burkholderiales bacterium]|nr:hypothetical protein [Burkholderiales bacterium]
MSDPVDTHPQASMHAMEPFPKPNTYPEGWLLDAIPSPAPKRESEPLPDWHEPFPEPNTYPRGWSF